MQVGVEARLDERDEVLAELRAEGLELGLGLGELGVDGAGRVEVLARGAREEALRLNAAMNANTPSIARFFGRMLPGEMLGRGTVIDAFKSVFPPEHDLLSGLASVAPRSELTAAEAAWLKKNIAADGQTDAYEKALMTFLLDEVAQLPELLAEPSRRRA